MTSLVSVITPSFNSARFIEECIDSVLAQTYNNWELIIVDDCSSDSSCKLIKKYNDKRIILIKLEINVGAAEARNIAIRKAKGRYIAFLDSDDLWMPKKLEKQIFFMLEKDIAFSFTSYKPISEDTGEEYSIIRAPKRMTYSSYLKNTIIGCLTVIIDREKTSDFQMPDIRSSHDMALWLLIMRRGFDAFGLDETLGSYRVISTSNTSNKLKAACDVWKVYREVECLGLIYSIWCFINYTINAIKKRIL
jgi:teichuronic acid biosynthesis glycosyltransferase TuaG